MTPKRKIIPIFVPHLGCPNDCVFCNQRKISGSLIPADALTVVKAIEKAKKYIDKDAEVAFYGGSFTAIENETQRNLLKAVQPYFDEGFVKSVRLSTRPDKIDPKALTLLKEFRVETIELGVQSMDDGVLKASGRGHTAEDTVKASGLIKDWGFKLILQMMTGLPKSDYYSDLNTAKGIISLAPDGVRVYPTVIIKDTDLYDLWKKGLYKEHTVKDAVDVCAAIAAAFEEADIPVIRMGLNPTDDLSCGEAAGGAYHPAFGQLVLSKLYLDRVKRLIYDIMPVKAVEIRVGKSYVSTMVGQNRANIEALKSIFELESVKVIGTESLIGDIEIIKIK